ncbi:hypothetical protein [Pseudoalteromonas piscicida]|uniref:hypothetical protein n=1 Tax=Pseudoalteromonas piscicida TaxID=43662 RepID=UPI00309AEA58
MTGCVATSGHEDFVGLKDSVVGLEMKDRKTYKYSNSGQLIRGGYAKSGQGLTEITKDNEGNYIYHIFVQEVLENTRTEREWIGKCLIYYVVDSNTYIIKGWGFDRGGNPLSL